MTDEMLTFNRACMLAQLGRTKADRLVRMGILHPVEIGGVKFWRADRLDELKTHAETDYRRSE